MDDSHTRQVALEDRVPFKQKVAYGFGAINDMWGSWFYPTAVWPVYNMFLHVNPTLVSIALMVNRLALAFVALKKFGLSRDAMMDIRTQLEERRGKV